MNKTYCAFYNDNEIAALLGMSSSWVRGQRFKRKHGEEHVLTIDPVYIGKMPKYDRVEVDEFVEALINLPSFA
jgi:hypothetical protein